MHAPDRLLAQGVDAGLFTHAVSAVAVRGKTVALRAFGAATIETQFDLASLTKPIATATGILQLAEQGVLHLRQPVTDWLDIDFGTLPFLSTVTIAHLLTHTSGLPAVPHWPADGEPKTRTDCLRAALSSALVNAPGDAYLYSDTGYIFLGEIIARAANTSLADYFYRNIAAPLGVHGLGYLPASDMPLAPTSALAPAGEVHDPRARDLGGVAGHAGLFGTAGNVLVFAEIIRTGGPPLLSRAVARRMAVSQIAPALGGQSYGWFCAGNPFLPSGDLFSDRAFGHSGFTGTLILIDPAFDASIVLLTNRVINNTEDSARFLHLRRRWLNSVAASLV